MYIQIKGPYLRVTAELAQLLQAPNCICSFTTVFFLEEIQNAKDLIDLILTSCAPSLN